MFPPWHAKPVGLEIGPRWTTVQSLSGPDKDKLLCLLIDCILELDERLEGLASTGRPTSEFTCENTCGDGEPSDGGLAAHLAALEAAGWVVVPREPSAEMREAGYEIEDERYAVHRPQEDRCAADCWRAMILAAPTHYR